MSNKRGNPNPSPATRYVPVYTKGNVAKKLGELDRWTLYEKRAFVRAIRIKGAFLTETKNGVMRCDDGYLVFDEYGNLYPIGKDGFEWAHRERK